MKGSLRSNTLNIADEINSVIKSLQLVLSSAFDRADQTQSQHDPLSKMNQNLTKLHSDVSIALGNLEDQRKAANAKIIDLRAKREALQRQMQMIDQEIHLANQHLLGLDEKTKELNHQFQRQLKAAQDNVVTKKSSANNFEKLNHLIESIRAVESSLSSAISHSFAEDNRLARSNLLTDSRNSATSTKLSPKDDSDELVTKFISYLEKEDEGISFLVSRIQESEIASQKVEQELLVYRNLFMNVSRFSLPVF